MLLLKQLKFTQPYALDTNTAVVAVKAPQGDKVQGLKGPCSLQAFSLWGGKGYNYTTFIPPPLLF